MTEKKQSLSGVLNLRVDEALSAEIERIAAVEGITASEAARKLLGYGVEAQRQIEASYLRLPYDADTSSEKGRIVIDAGWKRYTPHDLWQMRMEMEAAIEEAEEYGS
jgi:antitoxin component of RelBE/YafQ-DinJ toxin-antitoxin module